MTELFIRARRAITPAGEQSVGIEIDAGYGAGKTGLLGITRAMAASWGKLNIRLNVVAAGMIRRRFITPTSRPWKRRVSRR